MIFLSCSVSISSASRMKMATSQLSIARIERMTLYFSRGSSILLFFLMPAVSTSTNVLPLNFHTESTASRVVPISSATRDLWYPRSELISVDFPTFGRPTMAVRIMSSEDSSVLAGKPSVMRSRSSPKPRRLTAEIPTGSPSPSE